MTDIFSFWKRRKQGKRIPDFVIVRFYAGRVPDLDFLDEINIRPYEWVSERTWECLRDIQVCVCCEEGAEEAMREQQDAILKAEPNLVAFVYPDRVVRSYGGKINEYIRHQPIV